MASFKTRNGESVEDGAKVTLVLMYGDLEVTAKGVVRQFDHIEPVYEDDPDLGRIVTGKTSEPRWEISTDDPQHPAIGFLPENVKTKIGK